MADDLREDADEPADEAIIDHDHGVPVFSVSGPSPATLCTGLVAG
jgi:hypothetical protein